MSRDGKELLAPNGPFHQDLSKTEPGLEIPQHSVSGCVFMASLGFLRSPCLPPVFHTPHMGSIDAELLMWPGIHQGPQTFIWPFTVCAQDACGLREGAKDGGTHGKRVSTSAARNSSPLRGVKNFRES